MGASMNQVLLPKNIQIKNDSGETIPSFSVCRMTTLAEVGSDGEPIMKVVKPDGDTSGFYVVVFGSAIAAGAFGVAVRIFDAIAVRVDTTDPPDIGDKIGPVDGEWFAAVGESHLIAMSTPSVVGVIAAIGNTAGGSSSGAGSCPCVCLDSGDIEIDGIETTSRRTVTMSTELFKQAFGTIAFPAGTYTLIYDTGLEIWTLDIGDLLTSTYTSGTDATSSTTMDGTLIMGFDSYGVPYVELCVDGTVPEE